MAQLIINIPDTIAVRVVDGICKRFNYSSTLEDGSPNPETKFQFAKRKVIEFMKKCIMEVEVQDAKNSASETASASVETDIILS